LTFEALSCDDCGKQSTLPEESKRGRMKGAVAAGTI
jgi:hypothetical protein